MKQKIRLVNPDHLVHKSHESELYDDMHKNEFFEWLDKHGYSFAYLKNLFENKRIGSTEQNKFNLILKKIKEDAHIDICDSILYIEDSFIKMKKLINLLDDDTKFILKKELSERYKIKIEETGLYKILR